MVWLQFKVTIMSYFIHSSVIWSFTPSPKGEVYFSTSLALCLLWWVQYRKINAIPMDEVSTGLTSSLPPSPNTCSQDTLSQDSVIKPWEANPHAEAMSRCFNWFSKLSFQPIASISCQPCEWPILDVPAQMRPQMTSYPTFNDFNESLKEPPRKIPVDPQNH